jgi:hypothetical protein
MNKIRLCLSKWILIPCLCFNSLCLTSCDEGTAEAVLGIIDAIINIFGYDPDAENVDDQETADIIDDESDMSKVSWESKFPPIGDQGSYGTCVAWAAGYNLKTALNVMDGTWSTPSSTSEQCSPVDLWHLIPSSGKSTSCNGSNFDPAFQAMIDDGCATMAQVPFYNKKMTCDGVYGKGSSNTLGSYRIVAYSAEMSTNGSPYGMTVNNIKAHLENGPLVVGAKLGDRFMSWKGSNPITYDNDTYQGQHAYHAMALVGFDDSKNAFRLRNSWGASEWGDNGSIWVDYDFFVEKFAFGVWSANNSKTKTYSTNKISGKNVKVNVVSDVENIDGTRTVTYTITNNGNEAISTENYPICYLLFKAKHFAQRNFVMEQAEAKKVNPKESVTLTHTYSIPANMPDGKYYLALIADPYNEIGDDDRNDNFAFVTMEAKQPFSIAGNRIIQLPSSLEEVHSLVGKETLNAYRNQEIESILIKRRK